MAVRVLITGASRGIGAAVAKELASRGHSVIINYRSRQDAALEVKREIEDEGGHAELSQFDVTDSDQVASEIERLLENADPIGILVNNAGVVRDHLFATMSPESWDIVTQTSLRGFFNVTRPLVMPMVRRRWGRIITVSSVSGLVGNRGQVNYSAAKAGLIGATRSLAQEVARRNVTVNAVAPGLIETDMLEDAPIDMVLKQIPMRRLGQPNEVAKLIAFLVGDDAAYITGQVIGINGGLC